MLDTNLVPTGLPSPNLYQPGFERWLHIMGNSLQVISGCVELGQLQQCPQAQAMMGNHLAKLNQLCAEMRRYTKTTGGE